MFTSVCTTGQEALERCVLYNKPAAFSQHLAFFKKPVKRDVFQTGAKEHLSFL